MAQKPTTGYSAFNTPPQYPEFKDARDNQQAGQYPQYWTRKTRSGHTIILDDSKDAEHITIQHRGGSMIQFMPDGAVHFVSHNGQHNFVWGESRTRTTGAHDITAIGDSSVKTHGKRNVTTEKNYMVSTGEEHVDTAQSYNGAYKKQWDVGSESASHTTTKDFSVTAGAHMSLKSDGPMAVGSDKSGFQMFGRLGVGIGGGTNATLDSNAITSVRAKGIVASDAPKIMLNCKVSLPIAGAVQMPNPTPVQMGLPQAQANMGNLNTLATVPASQVPPSITGGSFSLKN